MVTIREYYDLFRQYAPSKTSQDFAEQAVMVGYSEEEVDEVLGRKSSRTPAAASAPVIPVQAPVQVPTTPPQTQSKYLSTTPYIAPQVRPLNPAPPNPSGSPSQSININRNINLITTASNPIPTVSPASKPEEHPLPAIILKPSSYVTRNKIGLNPLTQPAKSTQYELKPFPAPKPFQTPTPTSIPTSIPVPTPVLAPVPVPTITPNPVQTGNIAPTPIGTVPQPQVPAYDSSISQPQRRENIPKMAEPMMTMSMQADRLNNQRSAPVATQAVGSSQNFDPNFNQNLSSQNLNPNINKRPINVADVINRPPLGQRPQYGNVTNIQSIPSRSKSRFGSVVMILAIILLGGLVAFAMFDKNFISNISTLINDKAPYSSANVISGVFARLAAQKNIPFLINYSSEVNDKVAGAESFTPSPYQKDPAYARDLKRLEDMSKAIDLIDKYYASKKKYPKTLAEVGFKTLDPNGKPYGYTQTSSTTIITPASNGKPAVTKVANNYKLTPGFETDMKEPFSDYFNDLLTFSAKIDELPMKLDIKSNLAGEYRRSVGVLGDSTLSFKGPIVYANPTQSSQKLIDLQFVNHGGILDVKSNYTNKWVGLDNSFEIFSTVVKAISNASIWKVNEPISESVILSNQISKKSFRYDISLSISENGISNVSSVKSFLVNLRDQLSSKHLITDKTYADINAVINHKDFNQLVEYIGSVLNISIWVDKAGNPLKIEFNSNLAGRVSNRALYNRAGIEFGDENPSLTFILPPELATGSSTDPAVVQIADIIKDQSILDRVLVNGFPVSGNTVSTGSNNYSGNNSGRSSGGSSSSSNTSSSSNASDSNNSSPQNNTAGGNNIANSPAGDDPNNSDGSDSSILDIFLPITDIDHAIDQLKEVEAVIHSGVNNGAAPDAGGLTPAANSPAREDDNFNINDVTGSLPRAPKNPFQPSAQTQVPPSTPSSGSGTSGTTATGKAPIPGEKSFTEKGLNPHMMYVLQLLSQQATQPASSTKKK